MASSTSSSGHAVVFDPAIVVEMAAAAAPAPAPAPAITPSAAPQRKAPTGKRKLALFMRTAAKIAELAAAGGLAQPAAECNAQAGCEALAKAARVAAQALRRVQAARERAAHAACARAAENAHTKLAAFVRAVRGNAFTDAVRCQEGHLAEVRRAAGRRGGRVVASQRDVYEDLVALDKHFGGLAVDGRAGTLAVTTPPVVLLCRDTKFQIDLGRFVIRLQLLDWPPVLNVAPAPGEGKACPTMPGLYHPHVAAGGDVCLGAAAGPLAAAFAAGLIADAVETVWAMLQTYNPQSPYRALADWGAKQCGRCAKVVTPAQILHCQKCGEDVCANAKCGGKCAHADCREFFCATCAAVCAGCGTRLCIDHGGGLCAAQCGRAVCPKCKKNGRCPHCQPRPAAAPPPSSGGAPWPRDDGFVYVAERTHGYTVTARQFWALVPVGGLFGNGNDTYRKVSPTHWSDEQGETAPRPFVGSGSDNGCFTNRPDEVDRNLTFVPQTRADFWDHLPVGSRVNAIVRGQRSERGPFTRLEGGDCMDANGTVSARLYIVGIGLTAIAEAMTVGNRLILLPPEPPAPPAQSIEAANAAVTLEAFWDALPVGAAFRRPAEEAARTKVDADHYHFSLDEEGEVRSFFTQPGDPLTGWADPGRRGSTRAGIVAFWPEGTEPPAPAAPAPAVAETTSLLNVILTARLAAARTQRAFWDLLPVGGVWVGHEGDPANENQWRTKTSADSYTLREGQLSFLDDWAQGEGHGANDMVLVRLPPDATSLLTPVPAAAAGAAPTIRQFWEALPIGATFLAYPTDAGNTKLTPEHFWDHATGRGLRFFRPAGDGREDGWMGPVEAGNAAGPGWHVTEALPPLNTPLGFFCRLAVGQVFRTPSGTFTKTSAFEYDGGHGGRRSFFHAGPAGAGYTGMPLRPFGDNEAADWRAEGVAVAPTDEDQDADAGPLPF